jgi:hypothetical protein
MQAHFVADLRPFPESTGYQAVTATSANAGFFAVKWTV